MNTEQQKQEPYEILEERLNKRIKELEAQLQDLQLWKEIALHEMNEGDNKIEELTAQLQTAKSEAWDAALEWFISDKTSNFKPPDKAAYIGQSNTLTEDKKNN